MYEVNRFKGIDGLLELRSDWEAIFAASRNQSFYNNWCWHYCFARHLVKRDISYFLIRKEGKPVAVFPLQLASLVKGGVRWRGYRLPRHKHLDLSDVPIRSEGEYEDIFEFFVSYLRQQKADKWHLLSLSKFRQRSNLYAKIKATDNPVEIYTHSSYVNCGMESSLSDLLSRKHLKNIDRLKRRAEAAHGEPCLRVINTPDQLEAAFEEFLLVESSGWKGQNGRCSSINSNPSNEAFYRELIKEFGPFGNVSINLLELGDKVVAGQFCLRSGQSWHLLKIGYDENYQEFGPGNILLKLFTEEVNKSSAKSEINLVTSPKWADRWRFTTEPVYHTEIYNNTLLARLLIVLVWGRLIWRKHGKRAVASLKGKR